jgi:hypothetical protein
VNDRNGWIKVWRRLAMHPLWIGERFSRGQALVDLLMNAAHVDHQVIRAGRVITVPRGGVFNSQVSLAGRWRWDRTTVAAFFDLLKKLGIISRISTVRGASIGYTLVVLKNYDRLQSAGNGGPAFNPAFQSPRVAADKSTFTPQSEEERRRRDKKRDKRPRAPRAAPPPINMRRPNEAWR